MEKMLQLILDKLESLDIKVNNIENKVNTIETRLDNRNTGTVLVFHIKMKQPEPSPCINFV